MAASEVSVDDAPPDQINLPEGCRFTPRCPFAQVDCAGCDHLLFERRPKQFSACIYTEAELKPRSVP